MTPADSRSTSSRRLLLFFVLAFGFSWAFWVPEALVAEGVLAGWPTLPALGAFGPSVAGFVMAYADRGRAGVSDLAARTVDTGFAPRWLVVALVLFPLLAVLALGYATSQGVEPAYPWAGDLVVLPAAFVFILLLGGPVQEEFGWRGYALDPLQGRLGATGGGAVLGLAWGLWHLPLFYVPTQTVYYNRPMWGLFVSIVMLSVLMTWVYNNTGGSLLVMLLMHTAFNWSHGMLPSLESDAGALAFLALQAVVTLAVVVYFGAGDLVRDRPAGAAPASD